uniref:Ig-like domain-containing protein n=1 Tax=Echinostoma caproni TaxID=27848 RepID=A0A183B792_9TREM
LGSNVTIFCQWTANPRAEVTWFRGLPIPQESDHSVDANAHPMPSSAVKSPKPRISQLVFHNFREEDMDEYSCRVKNSLGTTSRTMGILINGLLSKFSELVLRFQSSQWDIIAVTETWLTDDILDSELGLPGMSLLRRDRPTRSGCVLLYHRSDLQCNAVDPPVSAPD